MNPPFPPSNSEPNWNQLQDGIKRLRPYYGYLIFRLCEDGKIDLAQELYDHIGLLNRIEQVAGDLARKEGR